MRFIISTLKEILIMLRLKKRKDFVGPTNPETNKDKIVNFAKEYLKTNSLLDMYCFIRDEMHYPDTEKATSFVRDVAYQMVGSNNYEFAETDNDKVFLIINRHWIYKRPILFGILTTVISIILSLAANKLAQRDNSQLQFLKDTRQDSLIQDLSSKQANFQPDTIHPIGILRNKPIDSLYKKKK